MKYLARFLCGILTVCLLESACAADDRDVVAYRQVLMKALDEQSAVIGQILSGAVPDNNLSLHLESVAFLASMVGGAFEAKVAGGESKQEVWGDWAGFSKRADEFARRTGLVAEKAKRQGKDAVMSEIVDALDCKGCHDKYRQKL